MKKLTILFAVAFIFALSSCNKGKDCKCTTVQKWDIEGMDGVTEQMIHIDKGECSDGNTTANMNMGGQQYTQTTTCVEI